MKQLRISFSFPSFSASHTAVVKVVLSDGRVHSFHDPVTAAELMLDHPREVVVEFDSDMMTTTTTGRSMRHRRRPVPLPADKKLEANKVYMMLPLKRGKPGVSLSSEEARRVVVIANGVVKQSSSSAYKFVPLFARGCTAGGYREGSNLVKLVTVKKEKRCDDDDDDDEEKITKLRIGDGKRRLMSFFEEEDEDEAEEEGHKVPEYLSRQLSGKGWRPSLDTIKEKKIEQQKLPHWMF